VTVHQLGFVGTGGRGWSLAAEVAQLSDRAKISAVVEPVETRRAAFQDDFSMPQSRCFETHKELLNECPDLDGIFVATPVSSHVEIACDCLEAGVPVFLEKPMALDLAGAKHIVQAAARTGIRLQVGFNLRYTPFFVKLKQVVAAGQLGRMLSIEWKEALAPSHWAEYCRHPTYNRRAVLGGWLLEKCCHDMDVLNWLVDAPCVRVSSFGSRSHFNPRPDVPEQCSEECPIEAQCIFSVRKLYGDRAPNATGRTRQVPHLCVYHSGSDLVDHQTAMLEFANGVTVGFRLLPLTHREGRFIHICGTDATLRGVFTGGDDELRVFPYLTGEEIIRDPGLAEGGHGGGDPNIVEALLDWLDDPSCLPKTTGPQGLGGDGGSLRY